MPKIQASNKTTSAIPMKTQPLPEITEKIVTTASFFGEIVLPPKFIGAVAKKKFKPSWGIYDSGYYTIGFSENVAEINGKVGIKLIEKFYENSIEDYKKSQEAENLRRAKSNWKAEMNAAEDK